MTISGNKGEWSEIYTLFKVLGDMQVYSGNESMTKDESLVYPIIKVLRTELNGSFEYNINQDIVVITSKQKELLRVSVQEFQRQALSLFSHIKKGKGSFIVPSAEKFMQNICCSSLKADSTTKTDITIVVHDERTQSTPQLGFSIKSQLGNPSTLLNAGKTTNFKYKIDSQLSYTDIQNINNINSRSKIKDRIEAVLALGGRFEFSSTEQRIFSNNLVLIDSQLPELLALVVFEFFHSPLSKMADLVNVIQSKNELGFDGSGGHQFYTYKMKRFLTDVALGMMPSKVWTGEYDATGGYLVVKEDGEVLCYHVYNRNAFENYLLNSTKLETASSTRHNFGLVYEEGGELYMNLNLQIRFIK
jgi:type II restriction enzyme